MPLNRQHRIRELFDAACEIAPEQQGDFLARECRGDETLAGAVARLLAVRNRSSGLLDTPAWRARDPAPDPLQIGASIGPYKILRELDRGGMGMVYQVLRADEVFQRVSAMKIVRPEFARPAVLDHFQRERQILARLDHPNIARIVDGGKTSAGLPYFVMDFVDGLPITTFCSRHRPTIEGRLQLFVEVCAAVQYLHDSSVVHSDLKPSNILVTPAGTVKILDFGIATILQSKDGSRSAQRTIPLMTPGYASPEQLRGEAVGFATDVYSLGIVIYELLTGSRPYAADAVSATDLLRTIEATSPVAPSSMLLKGAGAAQELHPKRGAITRELDAIVLRALDRHAAGRYPSCASLARDIENYLSRRPVSAIGSNAYYRASKFLRRRAAAVAISVALAALIGLDSWQAMELRKREKRAIEHEKAALAVVEHAVQTQDRLRVAESERAGKSPGTPPPEVNVKEMRQAQLLEVHKVGEAWRTSLAEAVRLWPGMTTSRRELLDRARIYLEQAEALVSQDPAAREQLALAWLWIAKIEGDPRNPNLHDSGGAQTSIAEATRVLGDSRSPHAQALLRGIRDTATAITHASHGG